MKCSAVPGGSLSTLGTTVAGKAMNPNEYHCRGNSALVSGGDVSGFTKSSEFQDPSV